MKKPLPILGLLVVGCSAPSEKAEVVEHKVVARKAAEPVAPPLAYQLTKIARSRNQLITTANYTGVILREKEPKERHYGFTARAITPAEVLQAEVILQRCASSQKVIWYWYAPKSDSLNGLRQEWLNAIEPLRFYSRQYQGLRTVDGQRAVWINAFPKEELLNSLSRSTWQTGVVQVDDGGKNYFNIYVNLDTGQCVNFMRNSEG